MSALLNIWGGRKCVTVHVIVVAARYFIVKGILIIGDLHYHYIL